MLSAAAHLEKNLSKHSVLCAQEMALFPLDCCTHWQDSKEAGTIPLQKRDLSAAAGTLSS
jgi:hypothetical protein